MAASSDDLTWNKKTYGAGPGPQHDSTLQDWQVTTSSGAVVTMKFREFATKHLLKPSTKGHDPLVKAAIIQSKRARTHLHSQDTIGSHWQTKYGMATQKNTMVDLGMINLKQVLSRFAQAILQLDPPDKSWKAEQSRNVTAGLGVAALIVVTNGKPERLARETTVTFSAKKLGNRTYEIYHLVPPGTGRR